ncbi:MAG: hypothetical protein H6636_04690 [Anaerolineales bacterium]|nr:hypothetical protein [Anaerolineales bacterium]
MDQLRDLLKNPTFAGIIGLVIGFFVGLVIFGWWLTPVNWTDAAPKDLYEAGRVDYLRMAIDSYALSGDAVTATQRWATLGDQADATMAIVDNSPAPQNPANIVAFKAAVNATGQTGEPGESGETTKEGGGSSSLLLYGACFVTAILIVALLAMFLFRRSGSGTITPAMQAVEASREMERTDYVAMGEEPPLTQFVTTFILGDDLFDDSFSIDSPAGEFLGECGVGIAETIGVGDPKRVTAFEVWLFDKNDIQTVTKVIMSPHAFRDVAIRDRLAAKGEPVEAHLENPAQLETQTLRLTARIADMATGGEPLPAESFFERFTLELAIWQK